MKHCTLNYFVLSFLYIIFYSCTPVVEMEETKGNLFGIVADKTTGAPVPVVSLTIEPGGKSTITGTDGSFAFNDLDEGKYTISFTKDGYKDGESVVTVAAGLDSEAHLLIERVPAVITVDREILDFGDVNGTSTMSFKIVNSGYETLMWSVSYDKACKWIKSVTTGQDENSGKLESGKTETLVVIIDREELAAGSNESTIIVTSNNGSSEIKIKAVGQEKISPSLNILTVENTSSTSVIINGEIVFPGTPSYIERGFVYCTTSSPTIENTIAKLTSPVTSENKFSYALDKLTLGQEYYVRAYVVSKIDTVYSSNEIKFSTYASVPTFTTSAVTDINIDNGSVVMNALIEYVGDPEYIERGFTYSTENAPDINDTKIVAGGSGTGEYHIKVNNLELDKEYFVRAYLRTPVDVYYGNEVSFLTATSPAEVSICNVSNKNTVDGSVVFSADILNVGTPLYTERGFVYSLSTNPTIYDNKVPVYGTGSGEYTAKVSGLSLDKEYHLKAYAINKAGVSYSSHEVIFNINTSPAEVEIKDVANKNTSDGSVVFNGNIVYEGDPTYTERGFVYGLSNNPTINDTKVKIDGHGTGNYSAKISGLELDRMYYVRSYAINAFGTVYSKTEKSFSISTAPPSLGLAIVTDMDLNNRTATITADLISTGDPACTERGFIYGLYNSPTNSNNTKLPVSGTSTGRYVAYVNSLELNKTYYVWAYAISQGKAYFSTAQTFILEPELPVLTVASATNKNYSTKSITLNGSVTKTGTPAYTERGFVYGFNTYPTVDDNKVAVPGDGTGSFSRVVSNLIVNQKYYVRTYAIQDGHVYYSSSQKDFNIYPTTASCNTISVTEISYTNQSAKFNGTISSVGDPEYSEKGFVYGFSENPTIDDNIVRSSTTGNGDYHAVATGLERNKLYYVRSYAKNDAGIDYGVNKSFTVSPIEPSVSCSTPTMDKVSWVCNLRGYVSSLGEPPYYEIGFVYSNLGSPTINDNVVKVDMAGVGEFAAVLTDLLEGHTYYVRAYAKTDAGVVYSAVQKISTITTLPSVSTNAASNENSETGSVTLNGKIQGNGDPAYTERGFVYSSSQTMPTIENASKVVVEKNSTYAFSAGLSGLAPKTFYYARAYATNKKGAAYGDVIRILGPDYYTYSNLMVQRYDAGKITYTSATQTCSSLVLGGYSDWRLPTIDELASIAINKSPYDEYGKYTWYWSSSYAGTETYTDIGTVKCYYVYQISDQLTGHTPSHSYYTSATRCVRSK